jgi:hypothetical protein
VHKISNLQAGLQNRFVNAARIVTWHWNWGRPIYLHPIWDPKMANRASIGPIPISFCPTGDPPFSAASPANQTMFFEYDGTLTQRKSRTGAT